MVPREIIVERILDQNSDAARHAAVLKASITGTRHHTDVVDCMIAGIAISSSAALASRNAQHDPHDRLEIIDPRTA